MKGWTLGAELEARNATHQIKKLTADELKRVPRPPLPRRSPTRELEDGDPPYYHPGTDSPEYEYLMARRRALDGSMPERVVRAKPLPHAAGRRVYADLLAGTGEKVQACDDHRVRPAAAQPAARSRASGTRVVPIIPDEARTFGLDALFRDVKIYAPFGQRYEPVDAELLLSYREARTGRILEEGITEAGVDGVVHRGRHRRTRRGVSR